MRRVWIAGLVLACAALGGCRSAQELAERDDNKCRGYGAVPGSNIYVQCRMLQEQQRAAAIQDLGNSLQAAGAAMQASQPQTVRIQTNCTSSRLGNFVNTNCL